MRFLFLNQYFPPDAAPTGRLLREVGERLTALGQEVVYVDAAQDYRGADTGNRLLWELRGLGVLLARGWRARRADVIFSASSPPLLLLVATLLAWRHRAGSVHWAMDLYPEVAVALGEIRPGLLPDLLGRAMGVAYRRATLVVALDEEMRARLARHRVRSEIIRPWVFVAGSEVDVPPEAMWTWIYSGNLGRAHDWRTMIEAQALLEARGLPMRLRIQGAGSGRAPAEDLARARGLRGCEFAPYVAEEGLRASILRCHVAVVTQRPEAQGLLWPSKLALLLSLPRPILWIGPVDGAIARELAALPHAGVFAPGQAEEVANWLAARREDRTPVTAPVVAAAERERALTRWVELLEKAGRIR